MNSKAVLAILVVATLVSGVALADVIHQNLAYISFNVVQTSQQTVQISISPAMFNLGNLTAGQSGSVSGNANVSVSNSGYYTIELKDNGLDDVFAQFNVTINVGNQTVTLGINNNLTDHATVYLAKGTNILTIKVSYLVSQSPNSKSVSNQPFLVLKYGHDNSTDTETTSDE